jgi:hypothetical protein
MDAEKLEKDLCVVMGGNGMFYYVKHASPKMSEIVLWLRRKCFLISEIVIGRPMYLNQKPERYCTATLNSHCPCEIDIFAQFFISHWVLGNYLSPSKFSHLKTG